MVQQEIANTPSPLLVQVDDFDVHDVHIETHNRFRMSQEYELLPKELKEQFELHVATHEQYQQQAALMGFLNTIPGDGSEAGGAPIEGDSMDVTIGGDMGAPMGEGAQMSANGAVPDAMS
jgi:hypothetical protein